uniref:Uncharacterized protein n=1 Tax=Rheinheimera sp. BAL341 TaxID=1708203 RepID=A0A486XUY9_9GAMM
MSGLRRITKKYLVKDNISKFSAGLECDGDNKKRSLFINKDRFLLTDG